MAIERGDFQELKLDEYGRVVLSDGELDKISDCYEIASAGGDSGGRNTNCNNTNMGGCINSNCDGSMNSGCTNTGGCDYASNQNCLNKEAGEES